MHSHHTFPQEYTFRNYLIRREVDMRIFRFIISSTVRQKRLYVNLIKVNTDESDLIPFALGLVSRKYVTSMDSTGLGLGLLMMLCERDI